LYDKEEKNNIVFSIYLSSVKLKKIFERSVKFFNEKFLKNKEGVKDGKL